VSDDANYLRWVSISIETIKICYSFILFIARVSRSNDVQNLPNRISKLVILYTCHYSLFYKLYGSVRFLLIVQLESYSLAYVFRIGADVIIVVKNYKCNSESKKSKRTKSVM